MEPVAIAPSIQGNKAQENNKGTSKRTHSKAYYGWKSGPKQHIRVINPNMGQGDNTYAHNTCRNHFNTLLRRVPAS